MTHETPKKVTYQELEESPLQDVGPQDSPLRDVGPQESPLADVIPQESPVQDVIPQVSPLQDVVPQESPLQDVDHRESPLQDVDHRESPLSDGVPEEPRQTDVEVKMRRVLEACKRLKVQEQKARELLKRTDPQGNILRNKIEKGIEIVSSEESSMSSGSASSLETIFDDVDNDVVKLMNAKYNDVEDDVVKMTGVKDVDVVEMMPVENESFTEFASFEDLSFDDTSEDPMFTNVNELMLVPSLSDLSLTDEVIAKPEGSLKSVGSLSRLSQPRESDSLESESDVSSESRYSHDSNERPDDSTEQVTDDHISLELNDDDNDKRVSKKSIDFSDLFTENNTKPRDSSFVEDTQKVDNMRIIIDFIDTLITQVTSGPPADELRRSQLDRNKLYRGLRESLAEHMEEVMLNDILNTAMVEYYRLTKNTRALAELSAEDIKPYYNRYMNGLACVAYGEERVAAAKTAASRLTVMAHLELNNAMLVSLGTEHHFEQTVRRVLLRDSEMELLKRTIARELRLMGQCRTEISYERYLIFSLKHDIGKLKSQIDNLDSFDDHVSMHDFLSLQSKVIGFEIKLEERNIELKKIRTQYHKELHLTQHNREKIKELKDKIIALKEKLAIKNDMRNSLREKLYHSKIQRKSIQDKSRELAYQGGILSMPSLMYDYDRTLDLIRQKQESIAGLKETVRSLTQRVDTLYPSGSQHNVNSVLIS